MFIEFLDSICYLKEDASASVQVSSEWEVERTTCGNRS